MPKLTADDYKVRLILFRGWKQKVTIKNVVESINKRFSNNAISETEAEKWYQHFDNGDDIFEEDSLINVSSIDQHGTFKNMLDSMVQINNESNLNEATLYNNGRFIIVHHYPFKNSFLAVNDLFKGTNRMNPLSFKISMSAKITMSGDYLLLIENVHFAFDSCKLHILKIKYDDLSVKELDAIVINGDFDSVGILIDQLDKQKFLIYDQDIVSIGQITNNNEDIILSDIENIENINNMYGKRLIDNKLQWFEYNGDMTTSTKFFKIDLETMERTETAVPIELDNIDELYSRSFLYKTFWSDTHFYGFCRKNGYHLLSFNAQTFKWHDIKISTNSPSDMFIDQDEMMTLQVGDSVKFCAVYRFSLRKPDKLKNLTRFVALRESNIYGNDKYINTVYRLPAEC